VLERPLRIVAIALTLLVTTGFTLFALDDFSRASSASRDRIAGYNPSREAERTRERRDSRAREVIDDANDVLLSPFAGIVADSGSRWVRRGVPALLGLLVYGFMFGYLARYTRGHG
jgi:H+/Cl- antiporter ClcA